MLPLQAELTPEERDRHLEVAARAVAARRLEVPAVLALELHRPLAFLGSQALVVLTPLLAPALGLTRLQLLARLLEEPENLDRLAARIEVLAAARDAAACPAEETP